MRSSSGIRLSITFTSLSFRFRLPCIHNCTRKVRMEKSTWLYRLLRNRGFLSAERAKCYTDFSAQNCWYSGAFLKSRYNIKVGITSLTKFGIKLASNAYGAPYAKNAHFRPGGAARFLLVEAPPQSPANKNLFQVTLPSGHRLRNWELLSLNQTVICKPGIISVMFTIVIILWRILRR